MFRPIIRVDDTSPKVDYVGEWALVNGAQYDEFVENGKPFLSTLHELKTTGSLGYMFYGQSGKVFGTNVDIEGALKPSWTCALDGVPILLPPTPSNSTNNAVYCEWSAVLGWHILTFNLTFNLPDATDTGTQPFLFDYIAYDTVWSSGRLQSTLADSVSYLPSLSESWTFFDDSWVPVPPYGMSSGSGGSKMTFDFYGTGLEVLGSIPPNEDGRLTATTATYKVDGNDDISFNVPSASGSGINFYQFFNVSSLPSMGHTLAITYSGNKSTVPLILQELIVYPPETIPSAPSPLYAEDFISGIVGGTAVLLFVGSLVVPVTRLLRRRHKLSNLTSPAIPLERRLPPASNTPPGTAPSHPLDDHPSPEYDRHTDVATRATNLGLEQPPVYSPT